MHDIRRWAQYSVGDDNPLFSEVDYAKRSPWGTVIAPRLGGIQWIFAGSRFEHFAPVHASDTITAKARLIDVQIKEGRNIAGYVNQVGEMLFHNQHGRLVTRYEATSIACRASEVAAVSSSQSRTTRRRLAGAGGDRADALARAPNVPTLAEAGVPVRGSVWF